MRVASPETKPIYLTYYWNRVPTDQMTILIQLNPPGGVLFAMGALFGH